MDNPKKYVTHIEGAPSYLPAFYMEGRSYSAPAIRFATKSECVEYCEQKLKAWTQAEDYEVKANDEPATYRFVEGRTEPLQLRL